MYNTYSTESPHAMTHSFIHCSLRFSFSLIDKHSPLNQLAVHTHTCTHTRTRKQWQVLCIMSAGGTATLGEELWETERRHADGENSLPAMCCSFQATVSSALKAVLY